MEQQQQQMQQAQTVQRTIGVSFNNAMDNAIIIEV